MGNISGIGKKSREMLGKVISLSKSNLITPENVVNDLDVSKLRARKLLQYWTNNGWLFRIRRGLYQPLPLDIKDTKAVIEDPWIVAQKIFAPCYIGGWTAVEFWGFTDQIFKTVIVFTSRNITKRKYQVGDVSYLVKKTIDENYFGLKSVWRDSVKVNISDPSRTFIDLLNNPSIGGGMSSIIDFFRKYLKSDYRSLETLLNYAKQLNNRTIFKRLGYILEFLEPEESKIINSCHKLISKGQTQFDPTVKGNDSIPKWSLLIPEAFNEENMEKYYD